MRARFTAPLTRRAVQTLPTHRQTAGGAGARHNYPAMYREMDMRFYLKQAEAEMKGLEG